MQQQGMLQPKLEKFYSPKILYADIWSVVADMLAEGVRSPNNNIRKMAGRSQILHLSSHIRRLFYRESQMITQLPHRAACTCRTTHEKSVSQPHPLLQDSHQQMLCFRPPLFRSVTTVPVQQPGRLKRLIKKMGWLDHSRSKLRRSGYVLYGNVCEKAPINHFFSVCDLPDTFFSWFLITELHVWMLMVRLMAEGEEGRFTRNALIDALWEDAELRSKKLGAASLSIRREQMQIIISSFQASLFAYDEGLMSDDKMLASALWRRLFSKNCEDPERLECCVQYVRKQIAFLDGLSRREFMLDCQVSWVPLLERDT
ncbi:ubiquinol-cytochrome-c reductase complex assembly factor 1 [Panulirus ornatus]|uniref:ubiquinol-cytochrome-c reductase complex assembly factor 1 n=1 Tax=Panulirus ornatus TaxID=150431 RepID=UPI003A8B031A